MTQTKSPVPPDGADGPAYIALLSNLGCEKIGAGLFSAAYAIDAEVCVKVCTGNARAEGLANADGGFAFAMLAWRKENRGIAAFPHIAQVLQLAKGHYAVEMERLTAVQDLPGADASRLRKERLAAQIYLQNGERDAGMSRAVRKACNRIRHWYGAEGTCGAFGVDLHECNAMARKRVGRWELVIIDPLSFPHSPVRTARAPVA